MITQSTLPAHLVNRDLKRELRYIPPGYSEKFGAVRVYRFDGEQSHLYAINDHMLTLDETADVVSGRAPMPPLPKRLTKRARKPKPSVELLPIETLPLFDYLKGATAA